MRRVRNPQRSYTLTRKATFDLFEATKNFDISRDIIKQSKLDKKSKVGLEAELIFFQQNIGLVEPTPDSGEKADFRRISDGMFFDVTTNLKYKDPSAYSKFPANSHKIALVNPKNQEISIIPLVVPKCSDCGRKAFFIGCLLRISDIAVEELSDSQTIIKYCQYCDDYEELENFNFFMSSPYIGAEALTDVIEPTPQERQKYLKINSIDIMNFLSKISEKIIFGLGETTYMVQDKDGGGVHGTHLYWIKPCANGSIENFLDFCLDNKSEIMLYSW